MSEPEQGAPDSWEAAAPTGRELSWRQLDPTHRRYWLERLWSDVCMLRERYGLRLRSGWWEDEIQVEALAALAEWAARYDSGEWDDPPGKLALLYDLQRVGELLRGGSEPFFPARDRNEFERHLRELDIEPIDEFGVGPIRSCE